MRHSLEEIQQEISDNGCWAWIVDVVWMLITSLEAFYLTGPAGYVSGGL